MPLFFSGHTRAIEYLVGKLKSGGFILPSGTIKKSFICLRAIAKELLAVYGNSQISIPDIPDLLNIAFSNELYAVDLDPTIRKYTESGKVFLIPAGDSRYRVMLSFAALIDAIFRFDRVNLSSLDGRIVGVLKPALESNKTDDLWEASIAASVMSHSVSGSSVDPFKIFGAEYRADIGSLDSPPHSAAL